MGNKPANRGRNINDILDVNQNTSPDARFVALRRTLLVKRLNTGRCTSAEELSERFTSLFELAFQEGFVPNVEMLAICSGLNRRTLHDIEVGNTHKGDGMSDVVIEAKELIGSIEATLALDGEINANVYNFRAKNYQGLTDKQEVVVKPDVDNKVPDNVDDIIKAIPKLDEGSQN